MTKANGKQKRLALEEKREVVLLAKSRSLKTKEIA